MGHVSRSGANKARDFWEEQACRFDDHYPLIASILRERGNQVWLAAECDRLTAENKALIAAASEKPASKQVADLADLIEHRSLEALNGICFDLGIRETEAQAIIVRALRGQL